MDDKKKELEENKEEEDNKVEDKKKQVYCEDDAFFNIKDYEK